LTNKCVHLLLLSSTLLGILLLDDGLDDTDSDGLSHVTNGETSERRIVSEGLNNHGLGGLHGDHAGITVLDELGVGLGGLAGTTIHLLIDVLELGGDVASVAIEDGGVAVLDLAGVGHDDDLGLEGLATLGWVVVGVGGDVATLDILDGDVLAVEAYVITRDGLSEGLVVHLDGLNFSGEADRSEGDNHVGLEDTSLNTADGHSADTSDLVDVLKGKTEGLVSGALGRGDKVKSLKEDRTLVPGHVVGSVDHVVSDPTRDGDEVDLGGLVADLLEVVGNLLLDIVVSLLGVLAGVHLVEGDDHLLDTKSEGKKGVLLGLTLRSPATLETTGGGVDDKDGNISLGGTSDHVLDEITVTGGINDGEGELGGLELPESDIDGDTTLTLGLEVIKDPGVLERGLAHIGSLLFVLLNGTLINTTALVD